MFLKQYRHSLMYQVMHATSPDAVRRHCDAAVQALRESQMHEYLVTTFIDKTIMAFEKHKQQRCLPAEQQHCTEAQLRLYELRQQRQLNSYDQLGNA